MHHSHINEILLQLSIANVIVKVKSNYNACKHLSKCIVFSPVGTERQKEGSAFHSVTCTHLEIS